ncbi:MAG: MMPL family transporter, partial [Variovorax sp.]
MSATAPQGPPSWQRRAVVLLVWVALLLAGVFEISRTHFNADLSAFLPKSPDARQRVLIEQLQSGVASRTLMLGIEGGSAEQRAAVSRAVAKDMRESKLFELVQNGDVSDWSDSGTWVFQHRYQLSPGVNPGHFTSEGLRDAINETLSMLGTPAGNVIKPFLDRDPTGETQRIAMELVPASAPRSEDGVWMSRTAPRALMISTTRAAGSDLDAQAVAIARVHSAYEAAVRDMG